MVHVNMLDLDGEAKTEVNRGKQQRKRPNKILTKECCK